MENVESRKDEEKILVLFQLRHATAIFEFGVYFFFCLFKERKKDKKNKSKKKKKKNEEGHDEKPFDERKKENG
jgi:hypothetical protein